MKKHLNLLGWLRTSPCLSFGLVLSVSLFLSGCYKEQKLPISAQFSITVIGNNYSVPVRVQITNATTGANTYNWTLTGANPATSSSKDVGTIEYDTPGSYTIQLIATNQYGGRDSKSVTVQVNADVVSNFTVINSGSYYPNVSLQINNTSLGATGYQWTFAGGTPALSTQQQPGTVVFGAPGSHIITLTATNGLVSYTKSDTIIVKPDLAVAFGITWPTENNDMQVPFTAIMQNNSISATAYSWSFAGASPATSTDSIPQAVYQNPGTYTITLTASNDKKSASVSKTITLLPNSNLYSFSNVQLGINTAQNTIGAYFSSRIGRVLKSSEVNSTNGAEIDFAYFGLNSGFNYNKILSPDSVQYCTFAQIPNAINLQVVNSQEICGCGSSLTAAQFDGISSGSTLKAVTVNQTGSGLQQFDNTLVPRVVLFQTADGRKGAVKIKKYVQAGQQSYIISDIKIMKQP